MEGWKRPEAAIEYGQCSDLLGILGGNFLILSWRNCRHEVATKEEVRQTEKSIIRGNEVTSTML